MPFVNSTSAVIFPLIKRFVAAAGPVLNLYATLNIPPGKIDNWHGVAWRWWTLKKVIAHSTDANFIAKSLQQSVSVQQALYEDFPLN